MSFQKQKVFYSKVFIYKKRYLKLYTEMTWHNNTAILFAEVSKFPSSLDFALETNFQNKTERLVYVQKYKVTYCIIHDSVTCQGRRVVKEGGGGLPPALLK